MIIEQGAGKIEKGLMYLCIAMMVPLFLALSRPAWDAPKMIEQIKSDCYLRHGVLLVHHGLMGSTYQCVSRLDGALNE